MCQPNWRGPQLFWSFIQVSLWEDSFQSTCSLCWSVLTIRVFFRLAFLLQVLRCGEKVFLDWRQGTVCVILHFQDVCFQAELPLLHQFQANQKFVDFEDDAIGTVWSVPSRTLDQADIWQPRTLNVERKEGIYSKKKQKTIDSDLILLPPISSIRRSGDI